MSTLRTVLTSNPVRSAARMFLITFLALFVPGLLGWLNDLTEWARSQGQAPFPDFGSLAYLAVTAIVAGVVGLVKLLWVWVEDTTGKSVLRAKP